MSSTAVRPPPGKAKSVTKKLRAVLERYRVTIVDAHDVVALQDYQVVVIADDSGSMILPAAPEKHLEPGMAMTTRWDEMREVLSLLVAILGCFDGPGLDIHFLNRGKLSGVRSALDPPFRNAFSASPSGSTPLTQALRTVAKTQEAEKPIVLIIFNDGLPDGGVQPFLREFQQLMAKESTPHNFTVLFLACTADLDNVGWLDEVDRQFWDVDVAEDYYSVGFDITGAPIGMDSFTRADWAMRAIMNATVGKAWPAPGGGDDPHHQWKYCDPCRRMPAVFRSDPYACQACKPCTIS